MDKNNDDQSVLGKGDTDLGGYTLVLKTFKKSSSERVQLAPGPRFIGDIYIGDIYIYLLSTDTILEVSMFIEDAC